MSTREGALEVAAEGNWLPISAGQAENARLACAQVAQRALSDLARPKGGSLLVFRDDFRQRAWPYMPEPCVRVRSIAEAHELWPTREFVAVLIGCEIPEAGVRAFAERIRGVASCVRYIEDSIEGVPVSADGGYLWPKPSRRLSIRIDRSGMILADLGRTLQGSTMWHESMRCFAHEISHLCYLERQRCLKAADRSLRRAVSLVAWHPDAGSCMTTRDAGVPPSPEVSPAAPGPHDTGSSGTWRARDPSHGSPTARRSPRSSSR